MPRFSCVEPAPPVELFALMKAYKADASPRKVDLGIGAYRTEEGVPWVLPVVRKVETQMAQDTSLNHEYIDHLGSQKFSEAAVRLLLGDDSKAIKEGKAVGVQCLGSSGSLRIGGELMVRHCGFTTVYISSVSWSNHALVFKLAGFDVKFYRYWDAANRCLDFNGLIEDLQSAPEDSVVLLHACAHNPTGVDPTKDQWKKIAEVMQERKLFPFFDSAFQGFASGNLEADSWAIRYFVDLGFELFCAQSFSKNFGLYSERVGNLLLVINDKAELNNVLSQIRLLIRGNYCCPPNHSAHIIATVLHSPEYFEEWKSHIQTMANRIAEMRKALRSELEALGTPGSWEHITGHIGMFSYTGLSQQQVGHLRQEHHVYLPNDGRISISGLNTANVKYVAKAIHDAVKKFP